MLLVKFIKLLQTMNNNDKTPSPWIKVAKLFLEFLIAAITAFFAASCVKWIM